MTCSTSCSSSAARAIAIGLAIALSACAGARSAPGGREPVSRIAIFPIDNRSGDPVALGPLLDAIELALARRGFEVVSGAAVDEFLERHRIRYTGAVDPKAARAARDELKVGGVLVTTIERYLPGPPPRVGITHAARLRDGRSGHPLDRRHRANGRRVARAARARSHRAP